MRLDEREKEWAVLMRAGNAGDSAALLSIARAADAGAAGFRGPGPRPGRGVGRGRRGYRAGNALLALHLKRQTWDENGPLSPWLYAIARHKLIDALCRRGRRIEVSIDDFAEILPGADQGRAPSSPTSAAILASCRPDSAMWCIASPWTAPRSTRPPPASR